MGGTRKEIRSMVGNGRPECSTDFLFKKPFTFFIFFQAEDGIRDGHVTGVQTCALPICTPGATWKHVPTGSPSPRTRPRYPGTVTVNRAPGRRSEERRVGKEGTSRC